MNGVEQNIIRVEHLVKRYNNIAAVNDVSFEIKKGEIFGLLGPNGAGKSTIISILCGLLEPTSGRGIIDGFDIQKNAFEIKKIIGVVPQEISLYSTLTARENLDFYAKVYGLPRRLREQRIAELLKMSGLTLRADESLQSYSGGMKRRINIAVALLHKPRILFMDEPTAGVDPQSRKRIYDTILELNSKGMTVLLTTHQLEDAEKLCHRIAIVDNGKLIALDTLEGLMKLVGESDIVRIEARDITQNTITSLEKINNVQKISVDGETMTVQLLKGREMLARIIDILTDSGTKVDSIQIKEPDLETLFLHLTGTKLRR
ncbi:ABC transporter ATP-binding protein [Methanosarcina sp. 1.H.T.1A.1]|uniref:ABC transporter ATP-binding protein n=1 Tax=Methanosarcina sp. 1.H.T.1A.1 TaxID=1483602 RepID=UPI001910136D|nr:ATP-binding cassette domain-containing protein [Methanosarcina sp. 1.H.T.1A.1]